MLKSILNKYGVKIIASILLVIFAFANTPKKFLHDAFVNHTHEHKTESSFSKNSLEKNITSLGCNCDIDQIVVTDFYNISNSFCLDFYCSFFQKTNKYYTSLNYIKLVYTNFNKGPPSSIS